jgi:hypothetical protein
MKRLVFIIIMLFFNNNLDAQIIKSFECTETYEAESCIIVYDIKVAFKSNTTDSVRLDLVKMELNKRYQIDKDNIISIQSWLGKRFRTFLYTIKVQYTKGCIQKH